MKNFRLIWMALIGIALCSCSMMNKEPNYQLSDLQGLWQEDGTQHFVRFTKDQADETGYFWGCEWDEKDDVAEEDLEFHGNGWFKYNLTKDQLLEIHRMNQDWADIPKVYIVSALTQSKLEYYLKDYKNEKIRFTKK